ncbi:metallophosphoesterase [Hydrogenovibrio sp.]|uniref:metallophosphoesterase n=1 Tax=Hydrogenovibrio sp. TaxID=2065821 RepID=UPI002870661E|nr:metallophosphoesterase [Hydrogenovibrio sp.]
MISVFPQNSKGRDFVISDLHGNFDGLLLAMEKVALDQSKDRLFALGDLIDGAEHSRDLVEMLENDWFFSVRGNHEQMLLDRFDALIYRPTSMPQLQTQEEARQSHRKNGGAWFDALDKDVQTQLYQRLSKLPHVIKIEYGVHRVGLVHAEIPEHFSNWSDFVSAVKENSEVREQLLWNRLAIESVYHVAEQCYWEPEFKDAERWIDGIDVVVHGHTPVPEPVICGNQVWIDTGHLRGKISLIEVGELLQITA